MNYFFGRLVVFVSVNCVVYVVGPSFMASRFAPSDWLFGVTFMSVVFSGLFTLMFGASEFFRTILCKRLNVESWIARDTTIAVCYLLACLALVLAPRPENFSFGDNIGLIYDNGYLTIYGLYAQLRFLGLNVGIVLIFWTTCRLGMLNTCSRQNPKEG